jgi:hypothetical protein
VPIRPYLTDGVFSPKDIEVMSTTLECVCKALKLAHGGADEEAIAKRIIELYRDGEREPAYLFDSVFRKCVQSSSRSH